MKRGNNFYTNTILPILSGSPQLAITFLMNKGMLLSQASCKECGLLMKLSPRNTIDGVVWRCHNTSCKSMKTTRSIRAGSVLEGLTLDLRKLIHMIYLWSENQALKDIVKMTGLSKCLVIRFSNYFRFSCQFYLKNNPVVLGGPGVICQVDESCFSAKQKYHVGRTVSQIWVLGIVDTSTVPAKSFMTCVEKRNAKTLLPIIESVCLPETIIHTDEWKAYNRLVSLGYSHQSVCHKYNFVNPATGAHTQHVESLWSCVKYQIKIMRGIRKDLLPAFLAEFMWRNQFAGSEFNMIIQHFKEFVEKNN